MKPVRPDLFRRLLVELSPQRVPASSLVAAGLGAFPEVCGAGPLLVVTGEAPPSCVTLAAPERPVDDASRRASAALLAALLAHVDEAFEQALVVWEEENVPFLVECGSSLVETPGARGEIATALSIGRWALRSNRDLHGSVTMVFGQRDDAQRWLRLAFCHCEPKAWWFEGDEPGLFDSYPGGVAERLHLPDEDVITALHEVWPAWVESCRALLRRSPPS